MAPPGDSRAVHIRPATDADVEQMRAIEVDAGERFRTIGLDAIADADPPDPHELRRHVADGTAWVATLAGAPVGYASASAVDDEAHLDQVSLVGSAAGLGIGRALIDQVLTWGRAAGFPTVTLTTFRDVAWNGPYYERLGFRFVGDRDLGPELRAIRTAEQEAGIDVSPRAAMRRSCEPLDADRRGSLR